MGRKILLNWVNVAFEDFLFIFNSRWFSYLIYCHRSALRWNFCCGESLADRVWNLRLWVRLAAETTRITPQTFFFFFRAPSKIVHSCKSILLPWDILKWNIFSLSGRKFYSQAIFLNVGRKVFFFILFVPSSKPPKDFFFALHQIEPMHVTFQRTIPLNLEIKKF